MRYELDLIYELCREIGLRARMVGGHRVDVDLGHGAVLCFQNFERDPDGLIGFRIHEGEEFHQDNRASVDWHTHFDHLTFTDARGYYVKLDYLDLVVGLKEGRILICKREVETADRWPWPTRWLIHSEYSDFRDLQEGERIVVRRAVTHPAEASRI